MQDPTATLDKLNAITSKYKSLKKDFGDIETLIYMRKQLACYLFDLAIITGEAFEVFKEFEYDRKYTYETERLKIKKGQQTTVSDAEMQAAATAAPMRQSENQAESIYKRLYLIHNAGNEVLQTLNQHIANLRSEKSLEMKGQATQG